MPSAPSFEDRVLDEIRPGLEFFKQTFGGITSFDPKSTQDFRALLHPLFMAAVEAAPRYEGIEIGERRVPAEGHAQGLYLRTYRPRGRSGPLPCVYWIHGGGMVVGATRYDDAECSQYADALQAMVVSVEYRLAPEDPYPAGVEDCYAGLAWTAANAGELRIDPKRLAIAGRSGGGVLAAATALLARDRGGPALCYQCLIYPMLDDRNDTASALEFEDVASWGGRTNRAAWKAVLGSRAGGPDVPAYAAPSRAKSLRGLPPTLLQVGDLEVFRDENIEYAQRLVKDGVACEFHMHPGVYHAADMFNPGTALAERMRSERFSALRRAFATA